MRRILLALIVLACSMPAADAARRDETNRTTAGRSAQAQKPPQQARTSAPRQQTRASLSPQRTRTTAPRQQAASRSSARSASRQEATTSRSSARRSAALRPGDARSSRNGVVVRGASAAAVPRNAAQSCTRRNGRTGCAPARSSIAGWQSGLPTASYAQQECPVGTFATLARGHDDVVRCMPL